MTSSPTNQKGPPPPYRPDLPGGGKMAILVPLIIGGAMIIGVFILWGTHVRKVREGERAKVEEEVRTDMLSAYHALRDLKPEAALEITESVESRMKIFEGGLDGDYADLKVARLMIEAEAEFMLDCKNSAPSVEEKFDRAMGMMIRASGEMWEYGVMGRARARLEQGKFGEAVGDLDILLSRNPSYGAAYYWRSVARKGLGDGDGSREDEAMAKNLDSWPPLRDFMRDACVRERDFLR